MTTATIESVDTALDVDLDFTPVLPCEGSDHNAGKHGHHVESPGAWLVISPCCGKKVVHCEPRVAAMRFNGVLICSPCGIEHDVDAYGFQRV